MNKAIREQNNLYTDYWRPIEKNTLDNEGKSCITDYFKNYLTIKKGAIQNEKKIYEEFKNYVIKSKIDSNVLCADLKNYADIFGQLIKGKSNDDNNELNECMDRLHRLHNEVTYSFLMDVINLKNNDELKTSEVIEIFKLIESYIFRRKICDLPTNSYNKMFASLHKNIMSTELEGTDSYVEKLKFLLIKKSEKQVFPNDDQFSEALKQKNIYAQPSDIKKYMFNLIENSYRVDTKINLYDYFDAPRNDDDDKYSIEHIMPQTLTAEWKKELSKTGKNVDNIHEEWLHRLGNLTVTLFNSKLSNKPFKEKRDIAKFGYKSSSLILNKWIAQQEEWGESQIQERNEAMVQQALKIWAYPTSEFCQNEIDESEKCCYLSDDFSLTNKKLIEYCFMDNPTKQEKDCSKMFIDVVKNLHKINTTIIPMIINNPESNVSQYFSYDKNKLRSADKLDNNIYVEKNHSNDTKLSILRKLFDLYEVDPTELVIHYKEKDNQ